MYLPIYSKFYILTHLPLSLTHITTKSQQTIRIYHSEHRLMAIKHNNIYFFFIVCNGHGDRVQGGDSVTLAWYINMNSASCSSRVAVTCPFAPPVAHTTRDLPSPPKKECVYSPRCVWCIIWAETANGPWKHFHKSLLLLRLNSSGWGLCCTNFYCTNSASKIHALECMNFEQIIEYIADFWS